MPGAPGWVSAGDSEPFAAHTHQHPAPSLRAAGHEWQKGAGWRGVARAHPKGSWISPHPHPHPPPRERRIAAWHEGSRGEGKLGQAGNFHPPGIN